MVQAQVDGVLHRNFQGYTTDPSDVLIGFGASAIGRLTQGYAQNEVVLGRYAERISRGEFATAKGYALTDDDRLRAAYRTNFARLKEVKSKYDPHNLFRVNRNISPAR